MRKLKFTTMPAIALSALLFAVTSCTHGDEVKNPNRFNNYEVIMIDSCEYIQYGTSYGYLEVTHKGDCKNPKHARCNCK